MVGKRMRFALESVPMLPKSRIVSALAIGLGLALVAWGVLFPRIVPTDARLPLSLKQTTMTLVDQHATQRIPNDGTTYTGPMTKQYHAELLPPVDQEVATARIGVSLMRGEHGPEGAIQASDLDRLVEATVWTYTFKRTTGMNTSPVKFVNMPATGAIDVDFSGYWVKFPLDAKQTSYEVFDATLRRTVPAVYKDSQERNGRTIYHYQQKIDPTNTADLYSTFFTTIKLPIKPAPPADKPQDIEAYLFHSGVRDYYVDQISGMIVDMSENIIDYYGDRNGGKLADAHLFAGKMSNEQSAAMLAQAAQLSDGHIMRIITWVVLGLGVVTTFAGIMGAFGVGRRQDEYAEDLEEV